MPSDGRNGKERKENIASTEFTHFPPASYYIYYFSPKKYNNLPVKV